MGNDFIAVNSELLTDARDYRRSKLSTGQTLVRRHRCEAKLDEKRGFKSSTIYAFKVNLSLKAYDQLKGKHRKSVPKFLASSTVSWNLLEGRANLRKAHANISE